MGVIDTKKWLEEHVQSPITLCEKLSSHFGNVSGEKVYEYLKNFGMYTSETKAKKDVQQLIEEDVWADIEQLFHKYRNEWGGANIPIFILPHRKTGFFMRGHHKSGLAFPNKLFLFLSPQISKDEKEALFIHEYHHVCRLLKQKKPLDDYMIQDSIILEGLAEYTVHRIKGEAYLAPWTKQYSISFLEKCWKDYFQKNLKLTRKEKKHDLLMYGKGGYPGHIGYCMGYYLVDQYAEQHPFSVEASFSLSPQKIVDVFQERIQKKTSEE